MKAIGIIAEYNPFHYGHAYQIQQAKRRFPEHVLVILMSGNVVQRGEFALIDKWHRAEVALHYGADLIIEAPLVGTLQSADFFASWGVNLLSRIKGVDGLVFGTESASVSQLNSYIMWYRNNLSQIDQAIQIQLNKGFSYPLSHQNAVESIIDPVNEFGFDVSSPNHLLGVQYMRANSKLESPLNVLTIPRIKRVTSTGQKVYSGSQIREAHWNNHNIEAMVMAFMHKKLTNEPTVHWQDYYNLLNYQLLSQTKERLVNYVGVRNGLNIYLHNTAEETDTYQQLINQLTTKRWPKASIQRLLMAILLNIHTDEWETSLKLNKTIPKVRVLAFNGLGRKLLNTNKNNDTIELFSNLTKQIAPAYLLNLRADKILQLNPNRKIQEQQIGKYPIYLKNGKKHNYSK